MGIKMDEDNVLKEVEVNIQKPQGKDLCLSYPN